MASGHRDRATRPPAVEKFSFNSCIITLEPGMQRACRLQNLYLVKLQRNEQEAVKIDPSSEANNSAVIPE
jgi:hypothetical protein